MTKRYKKNVDRFAEIALNYCPHWDRLLQEPQPPILPENVLPISKSKKSEIFNAGSKIDTPSKLENELRRRRKNYKKYLNDFAPELKILRKKTFISKFDWRQETRNDQLNFAKYTLAGKGNWEKVKIPHFGPPTGKAVTYYRTTFNLNQNISAKKAFFICFKGVDYKAHIFINGNYLGSHEGFFAPFEFDFTSVACKGENVLLVKVENDAICMGNPAVEGHRAEGDKIYGATGCGWDDPESGWHHCPPGMGIYQDVFVEVRNRVFINDVFVRPLLSKGSAEAWIEVNNCDIFNKNMDFKLSLYGQNFKKTLFCDKKYSPLTRQVPGLGDIPKSSDNNVLNLFVGPGINYYKFTFEIPKYRKWELDTPWLYKLQVKLVDDKERVVDAAERQFGMRSFEMDVKEKPKGRFYFNNRQIKLRGTNTMGHLQQCVINKDWEQLENDILLAKICNINFLRFTQRPVQSEIYDLCDKLGMMVQTDFPLFGCLRRNQFCEAIKQVEEMEKLIRSHPSNIIISYINEPFANGFSKPHRNLTREQLHQFFECASIVVQNTNPDRVIKTVDGDYDPPSPGLPDNHCYSGWYLGHGLDLGKLNKGYWLKVKKDWMYGCGEFGSEGLDNEDVMKEYYPDEWLPKNAEESKKWMPEKIVGCQTGSFHYMWFDKQDKLSDWIKFSQRHQRWITRMMTEAFRRDNRMNTFAIHLLIDAFPAGWMKALMDCKRKPKMAYYDYMDALSPIATNLRTDRFVYFGGEVVNLEAWVCNDRDYKIKDAILRYQVESQNAVLFTGKSKTQIDECRSDFQGLIRFKVPDVKTRSEFTVRLALDDENVKRLHDTSMKITVLPALERRIDKQLFVVGGKKGRIAEIGRKLKLKLRFTGKIGSKALILVEDFNQFKKNEKQILEMVERGARLVFMDLPIGKCDIADKPIDVFECSMGSRHFVSCKTGHSLVKGFEPDDFKFWYDSEAGFVTPFLRKTFIGKDFKPILVTGDGISDTAVNKWNTTFASAEMKYGEGAIYINQVELHNRLCNPVAIIYLNRLLGFDS